MTCEGCRSKGNQTLTRIAPVLRESSGRAQALAAMGRSPGLLVCSSCLMRVLNPADFRGVPFIHEDQTGWSVGKPSHSDEITRRT